MTKRRQPGDGVGTRDQQAAEVHRLAGGGGLDLRDEGHGLPVPDARELLHLARAEELERAELAQRVSSSMCCISLHFLFL